jgi:hypothetical protein
MWQLAVIYSSGKRYVIPFDILDSILSEEQIKQIKAKALKEIQKQ